MSHYWEGNDVFYTIIIYIFSQMNFYCNENYDILFFRLYLATFLQNLLASLRSEFACFPGQNSSNMSHYWEGNDVFYTIIIYIFSQMNFYFNENYDILLLI